MSAIPSFAEIEVRGRDAASYLHAQLANDIQAIEPGQWRFGSYCQVDGRVQSLMLCARIEPDIFRLLLPEDNAAEVEKRLTMYKVRAQCTIRSTPVSISHEPGPGGARYRCGAFDWHVHAHPERIDSPLPESLWTQQISLGLPWLKASVSGKFLPPMLALERLVAFTLKKGCYPGQEILARTHYLGRSKRRLVWLDTHAAPTPRSAGTELRRDAENVVVGHIVAADFAGQRALAVVGEAVVAGDQLHSEASAPLLVIDRDFAAEINAALLNGEVWTT